MSYRVRSGLPCRALVQRLRGACAVSGVTPYRTLHEIARALPQLTTREEIEAALDELEYLFEVIPPEMQEYAEPVIEQLRRKLAAISAKPV